MTGRSRSHGYPLSPSSQARIWCLSPNPSWRCLPSTVVPRTGSRWTKDGRNLAIRRAQGCLSVIESYRHITGFSHVIGQAIAGRVFMPASENAPMMRLRIYFVIAFPRPPTIPGLRTAPGLEDARTPPQRMTIVADKAGKTTSTILSNCAISTRAERACDIELRAAGFHPPSQSAVPA